MAIVDVKTWPPLLDTDDPAKRKLQSIYRASSPDVIAYLDFSVSTTGILAGVKVSIRRINRVLSISYERPSYMFINRPT